MTEFSAIVAIQVDEAGRPTALEAFQDGDTLASSVLSDPVRNAVSSIVSVSATVYDNSATWESGGVTPGDSINTSAYVADASGRLSNTSGYVADASGRIANTSAYVFDASNSITNTSSWVAGGASANLANLSSYGAGASGNISQMSAWFEGGASGNLTNTSAYVFEASGSVTNTSAYVFDASNSITNTSSWVAGGASANLANLSSYGAGASGNISQMSAWFEGGASGNLINTSAYVFDASNSVTNTSAWVAGGASANLANLSSYGAGASGNISQMSAWFTGGGENLINASGNLTNTSAYVFEASGSVTNTSAYVFDASNSITNTSAWVGGGASANLANLSSYGAGASGNISQMSAWFEGGSSGNLINTSAYVFEASGSVTNTSSYVSEASGSILNTSAWVGGGASANLANLSSYGAGASGNISQMSAWFEGGASGNLINTSAYVSEASGSILNTSAWVGAFSSTANSSIASSVQVLPTSAVAISGTDGAAVDIPKTGYILTIDATNSRLKWMPQPFVVAPGGTGIQLGEGFETGTTLTFSIGNGTQQARNIHWTNELSGNDSSLLLAGGGVSAFSGLNVSGLLETVGSSVTVGGAAQMPIPAPFAYIQLTADDVASSDEKHVGYSNTPTVITSNEADISWDDSAKNFIAKAAGTYECAGRLYFEGGSTLIELHVNVEGSPVNTANPRAHTTVDPVERTISAIFACNADDVIDITYEATSAQTTAAQIGTTVTIKRLK